MSTTSDEVESVPYRAGYSASRGDIETLKQLLDSEEWSDEAAMSALEGALSGDVNGPQYEVLDYLCSKGVDLKDPEYRAFPYAISRGNLKLAEYLISKGVDALINDNSALYITAGNGSASTIKWLLNNGVTSDISSIQEAVNNGNLEALKALFSDHSEVINIDSISTRRVARLNKEGSADVIQFLINAGMDPERDNNSLLRTSVEAGNMELFKDLIKQGLDVCFDGNYLIKEAAELNNLEMVELLIQHGANPLDKIYPSNERPNAIDLNAIELSFKNIRPKKVSEKANKESALYFIDCCLLNQVDRNQLCQRSLYQGDNDTNAALSRYRLKDFKRLNAVESLADDEKRIRVKP